MAARRSCVLFKQTTAYEMRISDWSSDVCSTDVLRPRIIEFTRLPDDDRAGAKDENGGNGGAFGHYCYSSLKASLPTKPRFIGKGDFFSSLSAQSTSSYRASAGGRKRSSFSPLS